nr:ORF2 [Torque teno felis virus]
MAQKPLPGPNLMLPTLDLSSTPDLDHTLLYKKREAVWKQLVSQTHKDWCLCGSYLNHFLKPNYSLITDSCTGEKEDTSKGDAAVQTDGGEGGEISDMDIISAGGDE